MAETTNNKTNQERVETLGLNATTTKHLNRDKNIVIDIKNQDFKQTQNEKEQIKKQIDIPKLPIREINLNKRQFKQFVEEGSIHKSYDKETHQSSDLPPSDLGDKQINISAIVIDKKDLSLHMEETKRKPYTYSVDDFENLTTCQKVIRNVMIGCLMLACFLTCSLFVYGFIKNV